jgi:hypothetical protein
MGCSEIAIFFKLKTPISARFSEVFRLICFATQPNAISLLSEICLPITEDP